MSDPLDPELRDALRGLADGAPRGDDLWDKTERRIAVHRRRRSVGSGLVSACVVLVMVGGVITVTRDSNNASVTSPPVTSSTTSTTVADGDSGVVARGERIVARTDGRIATVDDEWNPVRTIARVGPERFVRQIAVSPDGATLYYLIDDEPGYGSDCATLLAVDVETSRPIFDDVKTRTFALSPDGSKLALGMRAGAAPAPCGDRGAEGRATVRVVDTETLEPAWEWQDETVASSYVEAVSWDPSGARLAAEVCTATCRVVVVDQLSSVGAFTPLAPADQTVSTAWGPGGLWTLDVCCREPADDDDTRLRIRAVDPATGTGEELYVVDGESDPSEFELVALGDEWYLLRRTSTVASVEAELTRIDLAADPVLSSVAEGVTAVAEAVR